MRSTALRPVTIKGINFWIATWIMLVCSYCISVKYEYGIGEWHYILYALQLIVDVCLVTFGFSACRSRAERISRYFYVLIFISLLPGIFANESYNILINIMGIKHITKEVSFIWSVGYTAFLVIQIVAWIYLLTKKKTQLTQKRSWLTRLPYIQSAAIILVSLLFIYIGRNNIFNEVSLDEVANSALETILFVLLSVCLSRSINRSIIYLEMGFLLLIGFNLAHRFSYITGQYYQAYDVIWLLCLIVIIYGFYLSGKDKKENILFLEKNALQVVASGVFLLFANIIFILFALVELAVFLIENNPSTGVSILIKNIPSLLVFAYVVTMFLAKWLAVYASRPLENISRKIDCLDKEEKTQTHAVKEEFNVYEVNKLEQFVIDSLSKLHVANRVKANFLMNMSHDFRTPASGIYNVSKSIQKRIDDPRLKDLQRLVVNSSEQLMTCFEDILDYSRLESKQFKLNLEEFNVDEVIIDVVSLLSVKAEEKNISLSVIGCDQPIHYCGDKLMVHRVILNLVSNAIKFTEVGSVTINVSEEYMNSARWLVIKVEDTGIGIDEIHHKAIFEPFYRVESEAAKSSGIGLGLSNVKFMLDKIGGKIILESILGKGAVFILHLPNLKILS